MSCELSDDAWEVVPLMREKNQPLILFKQYAREQIPRFFDETFNRGKWNSGYITIPTGKPKHLILLVTLEKQDMMADHHYADRFISGSEFQWQSLNSTTQTSTKGNQIRNHASLGLTVHLFVRKTKKIGGRAAPFMYCGEIAFKTWEGEKPITVQWKPKSVLPDRVKSVVMVG